MKNLRFLVLVAAFGAAGLSTAPALAATAATPSNVPECSSNSTQLDLKNGIYAQELGQPGKSLDSLDVWGGCLKATYSDAKGHTTTAFYDPDTLKQVGTLSSAG